MFSSDPQLSEFNSASAGVMQQHQAKNMLKASLWPPIITSTWRRGQLQFCVCQCTRSRRHRPHWAAGGLCWKGEGLEMQHLGGEKAEGSHHAFVGSNASSCCIISIRSDFERPLRFSRQDFRRAHLIPPAGGHGLSRHQ